MIFQFIWRNWPGCLYRSTNNTQQHLYVRQAVGVISFVFVSFSRFVSFGIEFVCEMCVQYIVYRIVDCADHLMLLLVCASPEESAYGLSAEPGWQYSLEQFFGGYSGPSKEDGLTLFCTAIQQSRMCVLVISLSVGRYAMSFVGFVVWGNCFNCRSKTSFMNATRISNQTPSTGILDKFDR